MNRDEVRRTLADPDLRALVVKAAERFTDLALGSEPPARMFREVDSQAIEAVEEALAAVAADVPTVPEWLADGELASLADRAKQESYGL